eukprot:g1436.t1
MQIRLPVEHMKNLDLKFLHETESLLIASEGCRHRVLGVCDALTSRFKLSEKQLETLEEIGKSRKTGCLQSDLARIVGIEHKNFFFIMKQLEGRHLAVRNPIILNRNEAESNQSATTNIIHLPCFAPDIKLQQFQTFHMVEASDNDDEEDIESGIYRMRDDASWMRQICEKIATTVDHTALEFDVKQTLGFRGTKGHRLWRRLKKKMVDLELLDTFIASVNGKPSVCIRLMVEDFEDWLRKQREGDKDERLTGPESCIFAEQSLNLQLLQMIIQSGPTGISSRDLFTRLRLNSKKNTHRLKHLQSVFGIQIHTENRGKSCVNRCFAPMDAINKHSSVSKNDKETQLTTRPTVQAPPGGWMIAVQRAVTLGCNLAQELSLNEPHEAIMEEDEDSDAPSGSLPVYPDPTDEVQKKMRDYLFSNIISSRSDFRYKQLLEKIRQDGFILKGNIGNFFKDQELAHGVNSEGKSPDRKTIERVIHRLIGDQKIKKIKVSVLPKSGGEPKQVDVLIRNDLVITNELIQKIRQANRIFSTACRQRGHVRVLSQIQEAKGQPIPIIKNLTRLPPCNYKPPAVKTTAQGQSCHQVHRNGYIQAKMVRVKLLHNLICRLVGLAGFQPMLNAPVSGHKGSGFPRFVDPHFIEKSEPISGAITGVPESSSKSYRFAKRMNESHITDPIDSESSSLICDNLTTTYLFTPRQLWDSMPTDLYLQIVGSNKNCDELISQSGSKLRMDQVPVEKQVLLVDKGSRNRLAELLELLCRMKLLENTIGGGSGPGLMEYSQFVVYTTGALEEPVVSTNGSGSITQVSKKLIKFSFDSLEHLDSFWMQLEFVFSAQRHLSTSCFPATTVPEICSPSNWSISKLMSMAKWLELSQVMERESPIDWKKCKEIANKMNISYQQVLSFSYERRRKQRIKKSALETIQPVVVAPSPSPVRKRPRPRSPSPVEETEAEPESEEFRSSIYWCRSDDHRLLSSYVLWRTSNEVLHSKNRTVNWRELSSLPGGSSYTNISRCKRRFRLLQKQDSLNPLLQSLEAICDELYSRRWIRYQDSVPGFARDPGSTLIDEYCTPKRVQEEGIGSHEGDQKLDNPLKWRLQEESMDSGEMLESMMECCHPHDEELVKELKTLVSEITEKAPRMIKKETEGTRSGAGRLKSMESSIDWNSSVVSLEKKRKTLGFRLGKDKLTSCHHDLSLPVSLAKDFIVSCMISSQSHKFLTDDMAKELITRFKDDEMLQALSHLHQQGWINPGGARYPINLSPKFKNKLKSTGLSSKFFLQAQIAKQDLDFEDQDEDFLLPVNSTGRVIKESDVSAGCLAVLLEGVVREDLELSVYSTSEEVSEINLDFKVKYKITTNYLPSSAYKKDTTVKTTFTELLKGTETEIEADSSVDSQDAEIRNHTLNESRVLLDLVYKTGDNGIAVKDLEQSPELSEFENIVDLLEGLKARRQVYCFSSPSGARYLHKDFSSRLLFETGTKTESKFLQIRPWRDHKGQINEEFLEKIQLSIFNTVFDHPGISEDDLIDQISYCDVHNAKDVITAMKKQGLLKTEESTVVQNRTTPSFFNSGAPVVHQQMVFYFPNMNSCFQTKLPVMEFLD